MTDELNSLEVWAAITSKGGYNLPHCPNCGSVDCDGFECQDEDDYYEPEDEPCSCPYCHCFNQTQDGGICWDCYSGAHQG